MGKTSWLAKMAKKPKFQNRIRNRCGLCGRPRGFLRQFGLCRICLRDRISRGQVPGVVKASW